MQREEQAAAEAAKKLKSESKAEAKPAQKAAADAKPKPKPQSESAPKPEPRIETAAQKRPLPTEGLKSEPVSKRPKEEEVEPAPAPAPAPPPRVEEEPGARALLPVDELTELVARLTRATEADKVDEAAAGEVLAVLEGARMTLDLLAATGAGKAVNKLRKSVPSLGLRARALVDLWKHLS